MYLVQCLQCAAPNIYLSCKHKVHRCCGPVQSEGAQRDILLLDIALDSYFRTCIERTDRSSLQGDEIIELVTLVLKNAIIASENEDLAQVWRLVQSGGQQQLWELLLSCQRTPSLLLNMRPWHRPISGKYPSCKISHLCQGLMMNRDQARVKLCTAALKKASVAFENGDVAYICIFIQGQLVSGPASAWLNHQPACALQSSMASC